MREFDSALSDREVRIALAQLSLADWWRAYDQSAQWRVELRTALESFLVEKSEDWDVLQDAAKSSFRDLCLRLGHPIPGEVQINSDTSLQLAEPGELGIYVDPAQISGSDRHSKGKGKGKARADLAPEVPTPRAGSAPQAPTPRAGPALPESTPRAGPMPQSAAREPARRAPRMQPKGFHRSPTREPSPTPVGTSKRRTPSQVQGKTPAQGPRDPAKAERDRQRRLSWAKPQPTDTILVPPVSTRF